MRFRFVTYRWGSELLGGAELHHRRLAMELADLGHRVEVLTTDGGAIRPFCHWGVEWSRRDPDAFDDDGLVSVRRFPIRPPSRAVMALGAKLLQHLAEREERRIPGSFLEELVRSPATPPGLYALNGWHHPEVSGQFAVRWTHQRAAIALRRNRTGAAEGELRIAGQAPKRNRLDILLGENVLAREEVRPGWFDIRIPMSIQEGPVLLELRCRRTWRPWRDFRAIGVQVFHLEWRGGDGEELTADLWDDYRTLGRREPEAWQDHLLARAAARPLMAGTLFDRLRGPHSPALAAAAANPGGEDPPPENTIFCNLPWATMSAMPPGSLAMPLWHVEDDFFYWRHWLDRLRSSRLVLANNPYTAEHFFPRLGIPAAFVGPPIWEPETDAAPEARLAFRERCGAGPEEVLVLTVCRKSPEKRYDAVAEAVQTLRSEGAPVRMAGVGPDADRRPFGYTGCTWLGALSGAELQAAYAACDVFALMSESESFGMVIPEAWHHGKPVLVNRLCGPAASLVDDGTDGIKTLPGRELAQALRILAADDGLRTAMGEAGRAKAMRLYVRGASAERLMKALGPVETTTE